MKNLAVYLPQFHPISENNQWWGKGFTEWNNVVRSKARFPGHYQPHLPADLGFYDLRLKEVREDQVALAKSYGVDGFILYHYWFDGRLVLERPVEEFFADQHEFEFALCWANENWSRNWDGGIRKVLLEQKYDTSFIPDHCSYLSKFMKLSQYIKLDGRPLFIIYKPEKIVNLKEVLELYRKNFYFNGVEPIFVSFFTSTFDFANLDLFDLLFDFQPHSGLGAVNSFSDNLSTVKKVLARVGVKKFSDRVIDYEKYIKFDIQNYQNLDLDKLQPGFTPSWDNSARRQKSRAFIMQNLTANLYSDWIYKKVKSRDVTPFFTIHNAWNEWAEGCHLEPCSKLGLSFLDAHRNAIIQIEKSK